MHLLYFRQRRPPPSRTETFYFQRCIGKTSMHGMRNCSMQNFFSDSRRACLFETSNKGRKTFLRILFSSKQNFSAFIAAVKNLVF